MDELKIIIKVEIETLFDAGGTLSNQKMEHLTMLCANLQNSGIKVLVVSSGAIALGTARLGMNRIPSGLTAKQAVAAVGQAELIRCYQECFDNFDQTVAQILLTKDVIDHPVRNRNARNTLNKLLDRGIIPVINENDSVSTDDIIMNDNYPIALMVASLVDADAIVINTFSGDSFILVRKNHSSTDQIDIEGLLDLTGYIKNNIVKTNEDIEGFPPFLQSALIH